MKKIAIVDDEYCILEVLENYFRRDRHFMVKTYDNSTLALKSIQRDTYDLILLDIMMPNMDGLEFLDKIKDTNPNTKVVMMTAYDTLTTTLDAYRKGADDYIHKPFESLEDVKNKINHLLQ